MERVHGPQTPFESYCFACGVTFPVETKRCVHCGGRLARAGQTPEAAGEVSVKKVPPGLESVGEERIEEEIEEGASLTLRRFGGLLVWALVALSALLSNLCQRG